MDNRTQNKTDGLSREINSLADVFDKFVSVMNILKQQQTRTDLTIDVNFIGIQNHPKELIRVELQPTSVNVQIRNILGKNRFFKITKLARKIFPEKSSFLIKNDKIVLKLRKATSGTWPSLYYYPPEVAENFRQKFVGTFRSIGFPVPEQVILNAFTDVRVDAEVYWGSGCTITRALLHAFAGVPPDKNTPEKVIEYTTADLRRNVFILNRSQCVSLAIGLLYKEMKEYERENPPSSETENDLESNVKGVIPEAEEYKANGDIAFKAERYTKSVKAYSKAIAVDPQCHSYYLKRSIAYFHLQDFEKCIKDAREALALYPFSVQTHLHLAETLASVEAVGAFEMHVRSLGFAKLLDPFNRKIDEQMNMPEKISDGVEKVYDLFKSKKLTPDTFALYIFREFSPRKVNILCLQVEYFCARNMIDTAKEIVKCFMKYAPPSVKPEGYFLQMICALYEDDEQGFRENYNKCLHSKDPQFLEKVQLRYKDATQVYSLRKAGDEARSQKDFKKATQNFLEATTLLKRLYPVILSSLNYRIACIKVEEKKRYEAFSYLDTAIKQRSDHHEAFALRGECYLDDGKYAEAIKDIEMAINISPSPPYHTLLKRAKRRGKAPEIPLHELNVDEREKALKTSLANFKKRKADKLFRDENYDDAIKAYSEVIAIDSEDPVSYAGRSVCFLLQKRFKDALSDAELAVEVDPQNREGLLALCKCHIAFGLPYSALECLEKAKKPTLDNDIITEFYRIGELEEAIKSGNLMFQEERFEKAKLHFSAAVSIAYASSKLQLKLIDCLIKLEKFDESLTASRKALSFCYNDQEILYSMGLCWYYKGEKTEAIDCFNEILAIDPTHEKTNVMIKRINRVFELKELGNKAFREERWNDALSLYSDGLENEPDNKLLRANIYHNMGMVNNKCASPQAAASFFSLAVGLKKDYVKAYLKRANCFIQMNQFEHAIENLEYVNEMNPSGEHKKLLNEAKDKRKLYLQKVKKSGNNVTLAENEKKKGNAFLRDQMYEDALRCFNEAIFLNGDCPEYYLGCCECHLLLKHYKKALENVKQVIELDCTSTKGFIELGKCYNALGYPEEAIEAFQKVRNLNGETKEVKDCLSSSVSLKEALPKGIKALAEKKYKIACEHFKEAFNIAFADSSLLSKFCECLFEIQEWEQAFKVFRNFIEIERSSEFLYILGRYSYYMDEKVNAVSYLSESSQLDPSNEKVAQYLQLVKSVYDKVSEGDESFLKEDLDTATRLYTEALALDLEKSHLQAKLYFNIGLIKQKQNNLPEAIKYFTRAVDVLAHYTEAWRKRAECYREMKQFENALQDYQQLYDLNSCQAYLDLLKHVQLELKMYTSKRYYKVLQVPYDASEKELRKAFRNLAYKYHPDRFCEDAIEANGVSAGEEMFKEVSRAYSTLRDPEMRKVYDRGLKENVIILKPAPQFIDISFKLQGKLITGPTGSELRCLNETSKFYESE